MAPDPSPDGEELALESPLANLAYSCQRSSTQPPTTTSMDTPGMSQCLSVVELLEHILVSLTIQDILRCQSVCRLWKTVIDTSPSLQRALWMAPPSSGPIDVKRVAPGIRFCPIHCDHANIRNKADPIFLTISPVLIRELYNIWTYVNRDIAVELKSWRDQRSQGAPHSNPKTATKVSHIVPELSLYYHYRQLPCTNTEQSWMKMCLTSPPPKTIILKLPTYQGYIKIKTRNPDGVKIGDVVRAIDERMDRLLCYETVECIVYFR